MVASSYVLAATVCSFGVMFFGMGLGRRRCILLGNGLVIVGSAIQASSFGVPQICVGRAIIVSTSYYPDSICGKANKSL
jgi:hypothetical protein